METKAPKIFIMNVLGYKYFSLIELFVVVEYIGMCVTKRTESCTND